jgi:hypothetical protein
MVINFYIGLGCVIQINEALMFGMLIQESTNIQIQSLFLDSMINFGTNSTRQCCVIEILHVVYACLCMFIAQKIYYT